MSVYILVSHYCTFCYRAFYDIAMHSVKLPCIFCILLWYPTFCYIPFTPGPDIENYGWQSCNYHIFPSLVLPYLTLPDIYFCFLTLQVLFCFWIQWSSDPESSAEAFGQRRSLEDLMSRKSVLFFLSWLLGSCVDEVCLHLTPTLTFDFFLFQLRSWFIFIRKPELLTTMLHCVGKRLFSKRNLNWDVADYFLSDIT